MFLMGGSLSQISTARSRDVSSFRWFFQHLRWLVVFTRGWPSQCNGRTSVAALRFVPILPEAVATVGAVPLLTQDIVLWACTCMIFEKE
jgi:hypothetical protein